MNRVRYQPLIGLPQSISQKQDSNINALEDAGFVDQYPDSKGNTGGERHYFKEADGSGSGCQVSEYWRKGTQKAF